MARFVYATEYYCDLGEHVFRTEKYGMLYRRLVEEGRLEPGEVMAPERPSWSELEVVHTPEYLQDLRMGRDTTRTMASEMPLSRDIIDSFLLGTGGSILACRTAAREGEMTMNMAGGFHHAFADRAEGFCFINDVAVAAKRMVCDGEVERVMVVDCDLHQGNGTARICADDPRIFTFSIHQERNYPPKERSDRDVGLPDHCSGSAYLDKLRTRLLPDMDEFGPELVLYVAGADPYRGDVLGGLDLSFSDLERRDGLVIGACRERGVPAAVVLAGGYAEDLTDTVEVHYRTARVLLGDPVGGVDRPGRGMEG